MTAPRTGEVDFTIITTHGAEAATQEMFRQAGHDFQQYVAKPVMLTSVASVPFLQAAGTYVKGYEHLHGDEIRFVTT